VVSRDMQGLASAVEQALACEGFPTATAIGRVSRGRVLTANGDHQRGVEVMREGIEAYRATGQRIALPLFLAALAEGHAAAGDTAAARACVADGRAIAESTGDVHYLAELHRLEGTLHADDDPGAAERSLRRAIAVAREQGARLLELRATTSLARLALQPGRRATTRRTVAHDLARVASWFTHGTDSPDLRDARQALAELRGDRV
jgi:predicted ATPase